MTYGELPIRLRILADTECELLGEKYPNSTQSVGGIFTWSATTQGHKFWQDINDGKIPKKYLDNYKEPVIEQEFKIETIKEGIYKAKSDDKEYEIIIREIK